MSLFIRLAAIPVAAAIVILVAPSAAASTVGKHDKAPAAAAMTSQSAPGIRGTVASPRQGTYRATDDAVSSTRPCPDSILWD